MWRNRMISDTQSSYVEIIDFEWFEKEYQKVLDGEIKPFELMHKLELTKSTYYRYKQEVEKKNKLKEKESNWVLSGKNSSILMVCIRKYIIFKNPVINDYKTDVHLKSERSKSS